MDNKFLNKSIFKTFCDMPKMAWWMVNTPEVYKKIKDEQGGINGATIGDSVEDLVEKMLGGNAYNIETKINSNKYYESIKEETNKAISSKQKLIKEGAIFFNDNMVKVDFLVLNKEGKYDVVEVKSKSDIWKETKSLGIIPGIVEDISFQYYFLKKGLPNFSGNFFVYYLNKSYIKNGNIDNNVFKIDVISTEYEKKATEITENGKVFKVFNGYKIINEILLMQEKEILEKINELKISLKLSEQDFNKRYPYVGSRYLEYFGKEAEVGTIYNVPRFYGPKLLELHNKGKIKISSISEKDIVDNALPPTIASYITQYNKGNLIDKVGIKNILSKLNFPLFFYDYETVGLPIPHLDNSSPNEQVIAQYSLHIMDKTGNLKHFEGIIDETQKNNKHLLEKFKKDVGIPNGTFIVWNKSFENSKNEEAGKKYPDLQDFFSKVNENTFDLADIFDPKNGLFFHKDFMGSYSIKNVLPVLSKLSYKELNIGNGGLASEKLIELYVNKGDTLKNNKIKKDLLEYCKMDTYAMVEIYNYLKKNI